MAGCCGTTNARGDPALRDDHACRSSSAWQVLALDGWPRLYEGLQTQLQNGADALALAGAAELDRFAPTRRCAANQCHQSSLEQFDPVRLRPPIADVQGRRHLVSIFPAAAERWQGPITTGSPCQLTDQWPVFVSVTVAALSRSGRSFPGGAVRRIERGDGPGASASRPGFDQVPSCQVTPLYVLQSPTRMPGTAYEQASRMALQGAGADPAGAAPA